MTWESNTALPGFEIRELAGSTPFRLLTVDVEDWFHSNFVSLPNFETENLPRRVEASVSLLLDVLARAGAKATFFVLGVVAEEHPRLVARIAAAGHEIACHAWQHKLLYEQRASDLLDDLTRARDLLREHSGQEVLGFRAPSWSITQKNLWALDVIAEAGFRYDSSIFPAANYLYGIDGAPHVPYLVASRSGKSLLEVPPATIAIGWKRIGVGGGVYLRALPLCVHRHAMRHMLARGAPFVVYAHPREFDPDAARYRLPLSRREQWIHGFGLRRGEARLRALLRDGQWYPMRTILDATEIVMRG